MKSITTHNKMTSLFSSLPGNFRPLASIRLLTRLALAMAGVLLFVSAASAQTLYTLSSSGNWGTATNWSPVGVPNDIENTTVTVSSSRTATVDGSYATGYIFVGAGSAVNITGVGNSLALGNKGSSSSSAQISGNITVSSGGNLTSTSLVILNSGSILSVTNSTVALSSFRVNGVVNINEGASLSGFVGSSGGGVGSSVVFNGGTTGFGSLTTTGFSADRVGTLSINSGAFTGVGSFTLIDATSWSSSFSGVLFNGNAYTLGQDVVLGDKTWNVVQSGNDLLLTVIPEPGTLALIFLAGSLGIARQKCRHRNTSLRSGTTA